MSDVVRIGESPPLAELTMRARCDRGHEWLSTATGQWQLVKRKGRRFVVTLDVPDCPICLRHHASFTDHRHG
jgi:hypothetical protein